MNTELMNPDFPDEITSPDWDGDRRNVIDHYKYWSNEDIRADLAEKALPIEVVCENFASDFNISTAVRNANAFGARTVHIVGQRGWDRRGAVGAHNYTPVVHHANAHEFYQTLRASGTPIVVVDNIEGAVPIDEFEWPEGPVAVVFGQESIGVSNLALQAADHVVMIKQRGSVRSLNVGVTSGVILFHYAQNA